MKTCRHCGHALVCRPRGLCWTCYYTPGLRDQYPSTSSRGLWSNDPERRRTRQPPLPSVPTDAAPGSEAKIKCMIERLARGESLHHPDDAPLGTAGLEPLPGDGRRRYRRGLPRAIVRGRLKMRWPPAA